MTAGGITRIISQLKDRGRTSACVRCPVCDGGKRQRATLSVDLRDGVWLYLCHRVTCNVRGAVPEGGANADPPVAFVARLMAHPVRVPRLGIDPIADRVAAKVGDAVESFAMFHGLRVLEDDPLTHAWKIEDFAGHRRGWITRSEDKTIRTWRESERPFYGVFFPDGANDSDGPLVLVEDCLSAALLAEDGLWGVALLGTHLSREAAKEIAERVAQTGQTVVVALDPDPAGLGASQTVVHRLRAAGVSRVRMAALTDDVKNLDPSLRKAWGRSLLDE